MGPGSEAFTQLYLRRFRTLVRFILARISDREAAEDLAAEAFAIAWKRHQTGESISAAWLFTTAKNLIGNEYQRRDREQGRLQQAGVEAAVHLDAWDLHIQQLELRHAIARLPARHALVLQVAYWEDLPAADAATFLGCSVGTFWVRLTRARAALRTLLADPEAVAAEPLGMGGAVDG
ncbi:MAG: RNA polymerase sigma factor [Microbacterium sp.]|nr:RNA polymerase sigma factor [Microbacterium sp.]